MSILVRLPTNQYEPHAFDAFSLTGFSMGTGRAAAWLSQLSYEDDDEKIATVAQDWQLECVASFKPAARSILPLARTRGLVLKGRGAHFIAFAGTDPLVTANWVTDFDFCLDGDGIHQGFSDALNVAWPDIVAALRQNGPIEKLFVVGHSLGAALAVLCSRRSLGELAIMAEGIYTFGLPRTGGRLFAEQFNGPLGSQTFRFVHGNDIVATVPPSELGFEHVGRLIWCKSGSRFDSSALQTNSTDDPKFAPGLMSDLKDGLIQLFGATLTSVSRPDFLGQASRLLPPAIGDHLPDRYWRALQLP